MVTVVFNPGDTSASKYSALSQYDYGQVLRIQGLNLPAAVEIDFALQPTGGTSVPRIGLTKDGVTDVIIPDSMLENNDGTKDYSIHAFVFLTDATSGQTEYRITLGVTARPKPEVPGGTDNPDIFHEAVQAVREAAEQAAESEKQAEGWAHGREDLPERAEDNARYYAGQAQEDSRKTAEDRKEVERLVESVSGIDEQVAKVEELSKNAQEAATRAETSAEQGEIHKQAAENASTAAQAAAGKTAEDRAAVQKAKEAVEELSTQVQENKDSVDKTAQDFTLTAQQALADVNNAGQTQTDRVQTAGETAVRDIQTAQRTATGAVETAKTEAVKTIQAEGATQTGKVTAEGEKQVQAAQAAAQEIIADREQIHANKEGLAKLKEDIGELPNNIVSSTDSFVQYSYAVKSGEKHRFGLFDYSGDYFKQCEIYLFRQDNSYEQIGILKNVGEFIDYVATDNYAFVRYIFQTTQTESNAVTKKVYSHLSTLNGLSNEVEENRKSIFKNTKAIATNNKSMDNIVSTLDGIKAFVGEKHEEVYTITSSPTWKKTEITLEQNVKYDISVAKNDNIANVILYDTGYNQKAQIYNKKQGLTGISYTPTEKFTAMLLVYLVDTSISTDVEILIKSGLMAKDETSKDEINVLIMGDSYSALGNWVNELSKMVNINNLVNLGVSSATLKDKYEDTISYPYTSRPVMSSNDGNLNVFHNQVLKLKRLMEGTDLDSGESQIYTSSNEHPDVIFIEGGTNDNVDSATDNYQNILYDQKTCYVKYGENDIRNSNAYVKKEMSDVDKTTFVGALSYLHSELHTMFPNAIIILVGPCGLSYPDGNNMDCITIDNQLTEASKFFAMPVVHWLNTGVSYYNIPVSGDGTENNPYSIADTTDTKDWLHPTSDSANKLAKEAYAELKKHFNV